MKWSGLDCLKCVTARREPEQALVFCRKRGCIAGRSARSCTEGIHLTAVLFIMLSARRPGVRKEDRNP